MINLVLAEGHNIVRAGVRALLEKDGGFNLVAEMVTGFEVIDYVSKGMAIDVVLMDMDVPGIGGVEMIGKLKVLSPSTRVIVFTALNHEKNIRDAYAAGANGYLLKNVSSDELVFAIKHVHIGGRYICSELSLRLLDKLIHMPDVSLVNGVHDFELSSKEHEVLTLISEGFTNQEIADKVFTSKRTIEGYRQSLMSKTGSRNMAALIKFAVINRLIN